MSIAACPSCGKVSSGDNRLCPSCGARLGRSLRARLGIAVLMLAGVLAGLLVLGLVLSNIHRNDPPEPPQATTPR